jgi:bifunctional oligoribonuclease and PAP phosphatase NrnA
MNDLVSNLKSLIKESDKILITAHISPDGDSVCSTVLLQQILKLNFLDKSVLVSMEEKPYDLEFIHGYSEIKFQPLSLSLNEFKPDLLIILDSNGLHRITRDPMSAEKMFAGRDFKVAVIDHHEGSEIKADIYINNWSSAVTLDIYDIFINQLGYKKPENYAQTALTGIYTDTGGFIHSIRNNDRVFEVVPKLIADGADLEKIVNSLNQLNENDIEILKDLINNTGYEADYTYSYVTDDLATLKNHQSIVRASEIFRSQFLRNINGRPWGFIVSRDVLAEGRIYSVSFRALMGTKDVAKIAAGLGGGGHKPAAGAKFEASSVKEALEKVKIVIAQS